MGRGCISDPVLEKHIPSTVPAGPVGLFMSPGGAISLLGGGAACKTREKPQRPSCRVGVR